MFYAPPDNLKSWKEYRTARGAQTMKAYLFNEENGLYEGETFEQADMLVCEAGITPVPPPAYEHGQVPVFDRQKNTWVVIPVTLARQLLNIGTVGTTEKSS
jgi:hypothetical protein